MLSDKKIKNRPFNFTFHYLHRIINKANSQLMPPEDKEIIKRILAGSQAACRQLVEKYQQYAFSLAFRILCDEEEAKDTVQDSFVKIWRKINSFNDQYKFTTWMYKIVTNTALDKLRSANKNVHISLNNASKQLDLLNNTNAEMQTGNKEIGQVINLISEGLPEKQRLVFVLRDIQGFASTEVQEILDLPEDSIKSNLYHARKTIREKLTRIMAYERGER
jgi:RNA polymerase sigma-70 factor (ECF subfamily)